MTLTVSDGLVDVTQAFTKTITNAPPCLGAYAPKIEGARRRTKIAPTNPRAPYAQAFDVSVVRDDNAPFKDPDNPNDINGTPRPVGDFIWFVRREDDTAFTRVNLNRNRYELPNGQYQIGEKIRVRVT